MVRTARFARLLVATSWLLGACEVPEPAGFSAPDAGSRLDSGAARVVDADDPVAAAGSVVLGAIAGQAYAESPLFVKASETFPSAAVPGDFVTEWVSAYAYDAYAAVGTTADGPATPIPVGTIIVRAVQEGDGGIAELTLLFKGPPGSNPILGDWLFGVTTPEGAPLEAGDGGATELGQLDQCYGCHQKQAAQGFLFGVPAAYRAAAP
jgi:hypothetical protein